VSRPHAIDNYTQDFNLNSVYIMVECLILS